MVRPLKDEGRDTRRAILDAALDLFAQGGFAGTSMRQIARAVGVRESALYHHFPSKAAIFEALLEELGPGKSERVEALDPAVFEAGAPVVLGFIARGLMEEWATPREQQFMRLMMSEAPRLKEAGLIHPGTTVARAKARIGRLFTAMMDRGLLRRGDPELYFLEFMGPLMMLRLTRLVLADAPVDLERLLGLVDQHVQHFCQSVKP